jgi:hypothetical protein
LVIYELVLEEVSYWLVLHPIPSCLLLCCKVQVQNSMHGGSHEPDVLAEDLPGSSPYIPAVEKTVDRSACGQIAVGCGLIDRLWADEGWIAGC